MNKALIILKREYLSRVKKKSFIIMTILGPVLMAALMIVPVFIAQMSDEKALIAVVDETQIFSDCFTDTDKISFVVLSSSIDSVKKDINKKPYSSVLYIKKLSEGKIPEAFELFSSKQPGLNVRIYIENTLKKEVESLKLAANGIDEDILKRIETKVVISSKVIADDGKEKRTYPEITGAIGIFAGILIYMFIFMFGAQVMRGVIEEKTSRIIEVIVSSVKPFQLMMGKIIGVALVGLTQFLLWIVLTLALVGIFKSAFPNIFTQKEVSRDVVLGYKLPDMNSTEVKAENAAADYQVNKTKEIMNAIASHNFGFIVLSFIFFFLAGYLLYAALFAAIGSAVDNEADTQQFMLPVTIPLIFAIIMGQFVMNNPNGPVAFWLSIFPFTSPIIMMIRIPFGNVPPLELALSAGLLILAFILTTWFAAKIYRTGILMYGKKVNYKELMKWLFYKS